MRNADVIAQKLAASGCRRAYGIPGGEVLVIIDALERAGISFHLTKHENFAGFMAEGSWHASGAPGILVATVGPGVANAVNVIANAYQDRVPLIFITGCLDGADADTYTHQVFDHQALLSGIVKATFMARGESLDQVMDKALAVAMSGQPGPVHIDLPIRVAEGAA
ncbi:MAG: thiamine pyrophosphate-binding protein, partial [Pseudomonadota bacterium]